VGLGPQELPYVSPHSAVPRTNSGTQHVAERAKLRLAFPLSYSGFKTPRRNSRKDKLVRARAAGETQVG
jgi:hypothetical protein